MYRVAIRHIADAALVATVLFGAAGTFAWRRAWVLLAVLVSVRALGALAVARVQPALLLERAKLPIDRAQSWVDRALLLGVLATGFLGLPMIAARDVFHWHLWPPVAPSLGAVGLVLFALGWSLKSLALRANPFATATVRVQHAHTVADSGVYARIRHPFYAADPLILIGLGLWLQSFAAVVASVVPLTLMLLRLRGEEQFLSSNLAAYDTYAQRVPYRLIPGVW
jgi:protein-S-isoprenylcysteine O-methyltransferase Ste14